MKLVDSSAFNNQEVLLIEDPSIAIDVLSDLTSTEYASMSKLGPPGSQESWMTNRAFLEIAIKMGKVFLVQDSKAKVNKAAITFKEASTNALRYMTACQMNFIRILN